MVSMQVSYNARLHFMVERGGDDFTPYNPSAGKVYMSMYAYEHVCNKPKRG